MVFGLFGKKKEVVDFRSRDSDMPIPSKLKEKLMAGNNPVANTYTPEETSDSTSVPAAPSSGGGFFGFFGGGKDNPTPTPEAAPATSSTQVDFWGNPVATPSSPSPSSSSYSSSEDNSQISDVIYRLSRIADRLELVEKKIDRLERRTGFANSAD